MEVGRLEFEPSDTLPGWRKPTPTELVAAKSDTRIDALEKALASAIARIQALEGDLAAMQERQDEMEAELEGTSETCRVMWQRGDYA